MQQSLLQWKSRKHKCKKSGKKRWQKTLKHKLAEFRKIEESYHRNKGKMGKRQRRMDDTEKREKHIEYRN